MTTFFEKYLSFNKKKFPEEKRPVYFRIADEEEKFYSLYTLSTENVTFGQMLWSQDIFLTFSDELKIPVLWLRKGTSTSGRVFKNFFGVICNRKVGIRQQCRKATALSCLR
jgi:hypothetical protein